MSSLKGILILYLSVRGGISGCGDPCEIGPTAAEWALPNRSAAVRGDVEGYVAEVNPQILISLGYTVPTVVAELFVD